MRVGVGGGGETASVRMVGRTPSAAALPFPHEVMGGDGEYHASAR